MIDLVWPYALALLPLPFIARRLLAPRSFSQAALTVPSVETFRLDAAPRGTGSGRTRFTLYIMWIAWGLMVVAMARPQWTGEPVNLPTTGRDLMLAVDISGSMSTEDLELGNERVNRLIVVKTVVRDFIERRKGDRVGLILFGTNAYLQSPLTFDLKTVRQLLVEAPVGIAGGKTAIGDAIGLAVKRLRSRPEHSRVLILLTDGANNVGEVAPRKAAELARDESIKIHTIGVGNDQLRVPGIFGSRMVNPSADLDEDALRDIAAITGGQYYRARNTQSLMRIYTQIDALEPVEQESETYRPIRTLYFWPAGLSFILYCLLVVMDSRRRA